MHAHEVNEPTWWFITALSTAVRLLRCQPRASNTLHPYCAQHDRNFSQADKATRTGVEHEAQRLALVGVQRHREPRRLRRRGALACGAMRERAAVRVCQ